MIVSYTVKMWGAGSRLNRGHTLVDQTTLFSGVRVWFAGIAATLNLRRRLVVNACFCHISDLLLFERRE